MKIKLNAEIANGSLVVSAVAEDGRKCVLFDIQERLFRETFTAFSALETGVEASADFNTTGIIVNFERQEAGKDVDIITGVDTRRLKPGKVATEDLHLLVKEADAA